VQSYCGTVYLGLTSCPKMLPDPAVYAQCLQNSYDELIAAATPPSRTKKPTRSQPSRSQPSRSKKVTKRPVKKSNARAS
jgi:diacylglycerol O-acyltransferase / wax synthase